MKKSALALALLSSAFLTGNSMAMDGPQSIDDPSGEWSTKVFLEENNQSFTRTTRGETNYLKEGAIVNREIEFLHKPSGIRLQFKTTSKATTSSYSTHGWYLVKKVGMHLYSTDARFKDTHFKSFVFGNDYFAPKCAALATELNIAPELVFSYLALYEKDEDSFRHEVSRAISKNLSLKQHLMTHTYMKIFASELPEFYNNYTIMETQTSNQKISDIKDEDVYNWMLLKSLLTMQLFFGFSDAFVKAAMEKSGFSPAKIDAWIQEGKEKLKGCFQETRKESIAAFDSAVATLVFLDEVEKK